MNSLSKNLESCSSTATQEKQCTSLLKCGCPNSTTLPVLSADIVSTRSYTLATLNLDTTCICNPKVKLDFAANFVATLAYTGSLNVQVYKQCRNQLTPTPVGPAWSFNFVSLVASETFSFFVCDSDSCGGGECCTYSAVVDVVSPITIGTLNINNATLAATVVCGNNPCGTVC